MRVLHRFAVAVSLGTFTYLAPPLQLHAQAPSSAAFDAAVAYATETDGQAVLVMFKGNVLFEHYMRGGAIANRQMLASGSKSFVGVATIAAVADGWMQLDAPVSMYLTE